ncbi:MAG: hypothetical protein RL013_1439, partial [Bacteroidota bacterium]
VYAQFVQAGINALAVAGYRDEQQYEDGQNFTHAVFFCRILKVAGLCNPFDFQVHFFS